MSNISIASTNDTGNMYFIAHAFMVNLFRRQDRIVVFDVVVIEHIYLSVGPHAPLR